MSISQNYFADKSIPVHHGPTTTSASIGASARQRQDKANGALDYVSGRYRLDFGAQHIVSKALGRSIADAYAAYVAQVDVLPRDEYGYALYALDRSYSPNVQQAGTHTANLHTSPFSTCRAKHQRIYNTARRVINTLDGYVHQAAPYLPGQVNKLKDRPLLEEESLKRVSKKVLEGSSSRPISATAAAATAAKGISPARRPRSAPPSRPSPTPPTQRHQTSLARQGHLLPVQENIDSSMAANQAFTAMTAAASNIATGGKLGTTATATIPSDTRIPPPRNTAQGAATGGSPPRPRGADRHPMAGRPAPRSLTPPHCRVSMYYDHVKPVMEIQEFHKWLTQRKQQQQQQQPSQVSQQQTYLTDAHPSRLQASAATAGASAIPAAAPAAAGGVSASSVVGTSNAELAQLAARHGASVHQMQVAHQVTQLGTTAHIAGQQAPGRPQQQQAGRADDGYPHRDPRVTPSATPVLSGSSLSDDPVEQHRAAQVQRILDMSLSNDHLLKVLADIKQGIPPACHLPPSPWHVGQYNRSRRLHPTTATVHYNNLYLHSEPEQYRQYEQGMMEGAASPGVRPGAPRPSIGASACATTGTNSTPGSRRPSASGAGTGVAGSTAVPSVGRQGESEDVRGVMAVAPGPHSLGPPGTGPGSHHQVHSFYPVASETQWVDGAGSAVGGRSRRIPVS